jgi:hypothetical protein
LRIFDRVSAIELRNNAGLIVKRGLRSRLSGSRTHLIDLANGGLFRDRLAKQYKMVAMRARRHTQRSIN